MKLLKTTQRNKEVSVSCSLQDDILLFKEMQGNEALGKLFEYRIQLLSTVDNVSPADVLGHSMTISIDLPNSRQRHFNGIVTSFTNNGWSDEFASYEVTIHPWLWLLTQSTNCQIFQDLNVIDIIKTITKNTIYGGEVNLDTTLLSSTYEVLNYCVQYRESDFDFVSRILEEEGIYYYFEHISGKHTMILADSYGAHTKCPDCEKVKFYGDDTRQISEGVINKWSPEGKIQSSTYTLNDFNYEKAASCISGGLIVKASVPAAYIQNAYERFDYPGEYQNASTGNLHARAKMEAIHGQCEQVIAQTTSRGLITGGLFSLIEHPRNDQNREYLIIDNSIHIMGQDYRSGGGALQFSSSFKAISSEHSYRVPANTKKPVIVGSQTAMVVGKAGEEIWTDKLGRIKVQFHWDRKGKNDELSSCWVRVAQSWAGKGWGSMYVPRIGMEVVIEFLEGNPDRPLVTGCVYNSDAMPPFELPTSQTKSGLKSNSSKGGNGYNEISFEDKKDAEEILIKAQRNFKRIVQNNDELKVGFETKDKGDQTISIFNDQDIDVGKNQNIKIGEKCVIEAGTSIELKVGGSSIKIEPTKVTIKTVEIEITADATAKIKSGATMSIKSDGVVTIEGSLVKIN